MSVKLSKGCSKSVVEAKDMKDGQIGIIVDWGSQKNLYVGRIVQVFGDTLLTIGETKGQCWSQHVLKDDCLVRLLEVGEMIEVTSN
jgi:hypothetical protein